MCVCASSWARRAEQQSQAHRAEPRSGNPSQTASTRPRGPRRRRLVIVDPRRFGTGELLLGEEAMEHFFAARLGLEPLDERFTAEHLRALARGRAAPVKAFLLDQRRIAGVGNIYADEALFRAGIHPLRPAGRLSPAQYARLRESVIEALGEGIDARGATIDDFRHVDGVRGSFQDRFLVHRREGLPCPRCGTTIVKMVVGGRGTYVCERCQPRPRGPADLGSVGACSGHQQLVQPAVLGGGLRLVEASHQPAVDEHLGEGHHPCFRRQLHTARGVLGEVDLSELQPARSQKALDASAISARLGREDGDPAHYFIKYSRSRSWWCLSLVGTRRPGETATYVYFGDPTSYWTSYCCPLVAVQQVQLVVISRD